MVMAMLQVSEQLSQSYKALETSLSEAHYRIENQEQLIREYSCEVEKLKSKADEQ